MFSRRKRRFPAGNVKLIEVVGARYELVGVSNDIVVTIPRRTGGWPAWAVNAREAQGGGSRKLVIEAPALEHPGGGHSISNSYIGGPVVQIGSSSSQGGGSLPVVRIEAPRGVRIERV